jgi:hypothetical protein
MFDESLNRSRLYFVVLQTLRIMGEWIGETLKDVEQQKTRWMKYRQIRKDHNVNGKSKFVIPDQDFALDENIIGANWEVLLSFQQNQENLLLDRLGRKTEEVKSLRDGVSLES